MGSVLTFLISLHLLIFFQLNPNWFRTYLHIFSRCLEENKTVTKSISSKCHSIYFCVFTGYLDFFVNILRLFFMATTRKYMAYDSLSKIIRSDSLCLGILFKLKKKRKKEAITTIFLCKKRKREKQSLCFIRTTIFWVHFKLMLQIFFQVFYLK